VRDLAVPLLHLAATVARLAGPGGARSGVAESVLVMHQLLILNRSRKRSPNLRFSDRVVAVRSQSRRSERVGRTNRSATPWNRLRIAPRDALKGAQIRTSVPVPHHNCGRAKIIDVGGAVRHSTGDARRRLRNGRCGPIDLVDA
jgi:hypothetical protein